MTDSTPNDWKFTLEGGYTQQVRTTIVAGKGCLGVSIEAQRTGIITGRQSPWMNVALARVPDIRINCDMWENERWNGEAFLKTLHDAMLEDPDRETQA